MIIFKIPGEPQGKARPRITKFGTYTPEKTVNYEALIKQIASIEAKEFYQEEPLEICIDAYFTIPKSASKKKCKDMLERKILPCKKPDFDNLAKAIADACNGICYKDDAQIVRAIVNKFYADIPRVEVTLTKYEGA